MTLDKLIRLVRRDIYRAGGYITFLEMLAERSDPDGIEEEIQQWKQHLKIQEDMYSTITFSEESLDRLLEEPLDIDDFEKTLKEKKWID